MDIKPQWIDGHFYRYGEREKIIDDVIRTCPESAICYVGDSASKQDIYFAKKLLVLPPPMSTNILRRISADYSLRASGERDLSRADHYYSRAIEYLKRYLACRANDVQTRELLLDKLTARLVGQAYGKRFSEWIEEGTPLLEPRGTADQQAILDMIITLSELARLHDVTDFHADCFDLAMKLSKKTGTQKTALRILVGSLSELTRPLTRGAHRITSCSSSFLDRREQAA